jgi:hypothetical protein
MRYYKLVTIYRQPGTHFHLRNLRREMIGTMVFNSALARHELEVDEPTFLKHSKELVLMAKFPTLAVYVAEVRDEIPSRAPAVIEFEAGYNLAMDGRELLDDASASARAGHAIAKNELPGWPLAPMPEGGWPTAPEPYSPPKTQPADATVLAKLPFYSLRKIAKDSGVWDESLKGNDAIRKVILAKYAEGAPATA